MTTPYERAKQLNESGISAITLNLKAEWNEETNKWVKDKTALMHSLPNKSFLNKSITDYDIDDCKNYIKKRGLKAINANCVVILTNPKSSICVVDIDKGCKEFIDMKLINDDIPSHITLNKGLHYIFLKDKRMNDWSNTFNDIDNNIQGDMKHNEGFIICPPTYINKDTGYTYNQEKVYIYDDLRLMNDKEFEYFDKIVRKKYSSNKISLNEKCQCNMDELHKALFGINVTKDNQETQMPYDHYNSWFMIMCAIHTETKGHSDGLELFIKWAKTLSKD